MKNILVKKFEVANRIPYKFFRKYKDNFYRLKTLKLYKIYFNEANFNTLVIFLRAFEINEVIFYRCELNELKL